MCQQSSVFLNINWVGVFFPTVPFSCSSVLFEGSICPNVYSFTNDKRFRESICAPECVFDLSFGHRIHYLAVILPISIAICYT